MPQPTFDRALALAELLKYDAQLLDELEGNLLVAAGRSESIVPSNLVRTTELNRERARDVFRQLEETEALQRTSYDEPVVASPYEVDAAATRELFETVRMSVEAVRTYQERNPRTDVTPLATFPDDPAFDEQTPASFGMHGLMSMLVSQVKRCEDEIVILSPFFEDSGFERLSRVLLDALERGVEVTIVTRYLEDCGSHNHNVIKSFLQQARDKGVHSTVRAVDYTIWDDDVPVKERCQNGANPAFTLHAKVMVFDRQAVYVGSANVTDYGFDHYLELGTLFEGPVVEYYADLCAYLLTSGGTTVVEL